MPADTRLLEVRNGLTFAECLIISASKPELVQQWERLFADFVYEYIFSKFGG